MKDWRVEPQLAELPKEQSPALAPMRSRRRSPLSAEETRQRILDVAEDLFGERGVYAVSLREMNAVCKISQGVLHYHFGGREALVEAILVRQLPAVNEVRRRKVDAFLEGAHQPGAREVAEVLVEPLAELAMRDAAGLRFVRFLGRLHQDNNELYIELVSKHSRGSNFAALLDRCWPERDFHLIELALAMSLDLMFATLGALDRPFRSWQRALRARPLAAGEKVELLIAYIARGLEEGLAG